MEAMMSVLLVAPVPATLEPVAAELAVAGLRAKAVTSFEEATALATAHPYEVTIIAVEPPHREGAGLVRELKRLRPEMACIVVALHPSREDVLHALSAGALAYLAGPPRAEALAELVKERRRRDLS